MRDLGREEDEFLLSSSLLLLLLLLLEEELRNRMLAREAGLVYGALWPALVWART
jgi:hypothetical protein